MFSWNFRDLWGGVSGYLRDDLEQAEAAAQTKWARQHTATGAHGNVTATSVTTSVLRLSSASYTVPTGITSTSNHVIRLAQPTSLLELVTANGVTPAISGITMPGLTHGHVLYVYLSAGGFPRSAILRAAVDAGYAGERTTDGPFQFQFRTPGSQTKVILYPKADDQSGVLGMVWIEDPAYGYGTWNLLASMAVKEN